MAALPTGTVTFLFTDIEGSTTLWEHTPETAHAALVRHDALVEDIVTRYGGSLVRPRGEGDSRFAVFTRASDAVAAAAALQTALHAEAWPTPSPLRVRMALHTGEADLRAGDYYGQAVNRCARLRAVAHGGQTLLSQVTYDLVQDAVTAGLLPAVGMRDLGEHRLKDLIRPEHIHQLVVQNVPDAFPPLLSLDAHRHNLPVQRGPLLGREHEVGEVTALLLRPAVGLVTLTGPGGTGKTRLALQVAAELMGSFGDGVWFVDLAPLSDPRLVLATIAQILDVREASDAALPTIVAAALRDKQLLLVLDNFEQVVDAAPAVADVLAAAAGVKVLVTSREVLHLSGEHEYPVPPLDVPDLKQIPRLEQLTQYAAVQLFIQRAQAAQPAFQVTNASAPAVAEICVRLDGLPLAIELAAARVKLFGPQILLQRLESPLKTLTGGARDLSVRQQTLRGAIDWSYGLLAPDDQTLFRRLAVFVGGWTLAAAEAVCTGAAQGDGDVVAGLQSLVDKSLVRHALGRSDEPRFTLLETIRAYALEQLVTGREAEQLRQQHAAYYLALVDQTARSGTGFDTPAWLARLDADQDNLRAALRWASTQDVQKAVAMVAGLKDFWYIRGYWSEGQRWSTAVLPLSTEFDAVLRSRFWDCAGTMAQLLGDPAAAQRCFEQALEAAREGDFGEGVAWALRSIGLQVAHQGDQARAFALYHESLELYRQSGHQGGIGLLLQTLGDAWIVQDPARAEGYYRESLAIFRGIGYEQLTAMTLLSLAELALGRQAVQEARAYAEEGLALARTINSPELIIDALLLLGRGAWMDGDRDRAEGCYRESLQRAAAWGDARWTLRALEKVGQLALDEVGAAGDPRYAARLAGAVEVLRERLSIPRATNGHMEHEADMAASRRRADGAAFDTAWVEGAAMALDQAVAAALYFLGGHPRGQQGGNPAAS